MNITNCLYKPNCSFGPKISLIAAIFSHAALYFSCLLNCYRSIL